MLDLDLPSAALESELLRCAAAFSTVAGVRWFSCLAERLPLLEREDGMDSSSLEVVASICCDLDERRERDELRCCRNEVDEDDGVDEGEDVEVARSERDRDFKLLFATELLSWAALEVFTWKQ